MHLVVVLALPGVIPFELGIPARIFTVARDARDEPLYSVLTCTVDGRPVRTDADFEVSVAHDARVLATADTVVIPAATPQGPIYEQGILPPPLAAALALIRPGTRIVSVCNAAYVLAAAGLLDGRPATTHWRSAQHFQDLFPRVQVNADVLFVDDGDVLTSAGVAAGLDLCLHLVRQDHGSEIANQVARRCVVPPWRDGGQAQYIERPVPAPSTATTSHTRAWALERLDQQLTLAQLAAHARTSVRTFSRRFREEVGMTPVQWLTRERVELARRLLETSDLPMHHVARRAGFGTAANLRQHLHAAVGVAPGTYRHTYRGNAPARQGQLVGSHGPAGAAG
ncbi:helix-turn-helix domain-containing protein [Micromonospora sp. CPCC 206060]|uniref:GlxA family transcriptional regulator n=1 Tax=Micromonospora sp. CPCC 206060 TaxID=3122406 RepID=UPI002FEF9364